MGDNTIAEESLKKIDSKAMEICKQKHPFQRLVLSKEQALEMFAANPFKVCQSLSLSLLAPSPSFRLPWSQVNLIQNKVPNGAKTTVYKCGPLIDLCMGPHLPNTGKIKVSHPHSTSTLPSSSLTANFRHSLQSRPLPQIGSDK
jgi:threonyl-tRNA synthetase